MGIGAGGKSLQLPYPIEAKFGLNRVFSRDVTVTMLVSLSKGTAAMLVSPTHPSGGFLLFRWKNRVTDLVSENTPRGLYSPKRPTRLDILGQLREV